MSSRAIIAEDEPLLADQLARALSIAWPELDVVGRALDGVEAIEMIGALNPDVAFLDIQMPERTGLQVAQDIRGRCHVVFVTAYDQHAVEAFEHAAVDYLLKPVAPERLADAVTRLKARLKAPPPAMEALLGQLEARLGLKAERLRWLTVSVGANLKLIAIEDVCYFQSDEKYTRVVTAEGEHLIRKPLKELIDEVDPEAFRQIHRGTLVNLAAIAVVGRDYRGQLEIRLKARPEKLTVSRAFAHFFRQM